MKKHLLTALLNYNSLRIAGYKPYRYWHFCNLLHKVCFLRTAITLPQEVPINNPAEAVKEVSIISISHTLLQGTFISSLQKLCVLRIREKLCSTSLEYYDSLPLPSRLKSKVTMEDMLFELQQVYADTIMAKT